MPDLIRCSLARRCGRRRGAAAPVGVGDRVPPMTPAAASAPTSVPIAVMTPATAVREPGIVFQNDVGRFAGV